MMMLADLMLIPLDIIAEDCNGIYAQVYIKHLNFQKLNMYLYIIPRLYFY